MRKINEIKKLLQDNKDEKEEQKETSDIDILVEFKKPIDLLTFVSLKNHLSDLLNVNVDLAMKKALKPNIRKNILREALYI